MFQTYTQKPQHIAFIMDGNRRWAQENGKLPHEGHREGRNTAEKVVEWAVEAGIPHVTFWALSTDNWQKRNTLERNMLFHLIEEIPTRFEKMKQHGVQLKFIGRRKGLPDHIQNVLAKCEETLRVEHPKHTVYLALNYGGRDEILHAIEDIREATITGPLTEEHFSQFLFTKGVPDVELIVRTGRQKRLSGFMPWQSIYAELYFSDTYWPAFSKEEFHETLAFFANTKRNFGK